jgi:hypothetical protein
MWLHRKKFIYIVTNLLFNLAKICLHGERVADIPFPMTIRNELVNSGRVTPHHVLPESGWVSYYIDKGEHDIPAIIELFRLRARREKADGSNLILTVQEEGMVKKKREIMIFARL